MKAIFTLIACALIAGRISAASPVATVDWVAKQIAASLKGSSTPSPAEVVATKPQEFSRTFASTMTASDGNTYDVEVKVDACTRLALIVTDSTLAGVTNGTVYAWNEFSGQFETAMSDVMPVIVARTVDVQDVSTNLAGMVQTSTNRITRYSAATALGDYNSATWYGRRCLVSTNGTRVIFTVSTIGTRQYAAAQMPDAAAMPQRQALFAAWAAGPDEGVSHYNGNLQITTITIKRKGREEAYTFNWCLTFNSGIGTGTVAEHALAAFEDWYARPKDGIFQAARAAVVERLVDYGAWGLEPDETAKLDLGADQLAIRYKDLYDCTAFKSAFQSAQEYLAEEWVRIFLTLYDALKLHDCPALGPNETRWTADMNCCCRYTYPDLATGANIACQMANVPQHKWATYRLVDGVLRLTDGVGCKLCTRCLQSDEKEGAVHVPVGDEADYCGCCCGYYYEKKVEDDETGGEGEGEGEGEEIYTDCEIVVETPDDEGDCITSTNIVPAAGIVMWSHVKKRVRSATGDMITVLTSKGGAMENLPKMHSKPWHPLKCTCKCAREHWFKPSACPKICRGCGYAEDAFENGELKASAKDRNINVRGYHVQMADGYFDAESYTRLIAEGEFLTFEWSNLSGNSEIPSPYARWLKETLTDGARKCGCACGRFWSDANGNHGASGRDTDGHVTDDGHHGNFHIYTTRPVSDIACPFTRHHLESTGVKEVQYCTCNNWDWECSSKDAFAANASSPYSTVGWIGRHDSSPGSAENSTGSLACRHVCRFHWPYSHSGENGALELNHKMHTPYMAGLKTLQADSLLDAYEAWRNGEETCGCLCLAVQRSSCEDGDSALGFTFPVRFSNLSPHFHFYDFSDSCICKCGTSHYAVTPESLETILSGLSEEIAFGTCSRLGGVCQLCGFATRSGPVESIVRAPIDSHVPGAACSCSCAASGKKVFTEGDKKVRGWSAMQDGDKYPNNTRQGSAGFTSFESAKIWHNSAKLGCLCTCGNDLGYELYHDHKPGECPAVCIATPYGSGSICGHAPDYYAYKPESKSYVDQMGEHVRSAGADYCGCDCGHMITRTGKDGVTVSWHSAADGDCYCFGKYAATSPYEHGDKALVEHINLVVVGIETNSTTCSAAGCGKAYDTTRNVYRCDNDHVVYGKSSGLKNCAHQGTCPRGCGCCNLMERSCTCPWCNMVEGAIGQCTCDGRVSDVPGTTFKITVPLITSELWLDLARGVVWGGIDTIDGDDPVYEIGESALHGALAFCTNLVTVKFNYVTNIANRGMAGAFQDCQKLKSLQFARLKEVGAQAFAATFVGVEDIDLHFPALKRIGNFAFEHSCLSGISLPVATDELDSTAEGWFSFCTKLKSANLPRAKYIPFRCFQECSSLRDVSLPELEGMGISAFSGCRSLESISLPKLKFIPFNAFDDCVSLKTIDVPSMSTNDLIWVQGELLNEFPVGCTVKFKDGVLHF